MLFRSRIARPPKIDGRLDDEVYTVVPGAGDFVQQIPRENTPATEKTLIWVLFDDKNLYISARAYDTHPELEIATEMRRDDNNLVSNESLSFVLDTFYDRRNGFFFQTGPLGTIRDQAVQDDQTNQSWNTVWEVRSARDDEGWTTELQIPFKSLRYAGSGPQVWGFNVRRVVKWKNENDYFSAAPASFGIGAINRMQTGGTLVGIETPLQSLNLEFKPYVVSTLTTDRTAPVPYSNDLGKNIGVDFKYGLTRGLVLQQVQHEHAQVAVFEDALAATATFVEAGVAVAVAAVVGFESGFHGFFDVLTMYLRYIASASVARPCRLASPNFAQDGSPREGPHPGPGDAQCSWASRKAMARWAPTMSCRRTNHTASSTATSSGLSLGTCPTSSWRASRRACRAASSWSQNSATWASRNCCCRASTGSVCAWAGGSAAAACGMNWLVITASAAWRVSSRSGRCFMIVLRWVRCPDFARATCQGRYGPACPHCRCHTA